MIFVDGLHEADQAVRDVLNALDFLRSTSEGVVLMHDGRPVELNEGKVPRKSGAYFWTGDVWRGNSWQLIII